MRKQATLSPRVEPVPLPTSPTGRPSKAQQPRPQPGALDGGLGFLSSKRDLLEADLKIVPPASFLTDNVGASSVKGRKASAKTKDRSRAAEGVVVRVEVQQSLDALRNRKGDTGSVLWRVR